MARRATSTLSHTANSRRIASTAYALTFRRPTRHWRTISPAVYRPRPSLLKDAGVTCTRISDGPVPWPSIFAAALMMSCRLWVTVFSLSAGSLPAPRGENGGAHRRGGRGGREGTGGQVGRSAAPAAICDAGLLRYLGRLPTTDNLGSSGSAWSAASSCLEAAIWRTMSSRCFSIVERSRAMESFGSSLP